MRLFSIQNTYEKINFVLLIIMLFLPKEIHYIAISLFVLISFIFLEKNKKKTYKIKNLAIVYIFILLISISLIIGVSKNINHFFLIKDFFHFSFPLVIILYGISISKYIRKKIFFKQLIHLGTLSSFIYLFKAAIFLVQTNNLYEFRNVAGTISVLGVIALSNTIFNFFDLEIKKKKMIIIINAFALAISFSRVNLIIFMTYFIFYFLKEKKIQLIFKISIIAIVGFFISFQIAPDITSKFIEKIENTFIEISADTNFTSEKSINENWRGYEKYKSEEQFKATDHIYKIFGQGAGFELELGINIELGNQMMSEVPYIHNGYMNSLNKFGILGVFLNFIIYVLFFKFKKGYYYNNGTVVSLILTSLVVGGIFAMSGSWELLLITVFLNNERAVEINGSMRNSQL